jgi:hypothetical protein
MFSTTLAMLRSSCQLAIGVTKAQQRNQKAVYLSCMYGVLQVMTVSGAASTHCPVACCVSQSTDRVCSLTCSAADSAAMRSALWPSTLPDSESGAE